MVEKTNALYDESDDAPLVADPFVIEEPVATPVDSATTPTTPSDSASASLTDPLLPSVDNNDEKKNNNSSGEEGDEEQSRIVAAGVGSAIVGFLIGGPIGAAILGFGAVYAAEKKEGVVGDGARAVGDFTLSAKDKAAALDSKHNVSVKSKEVVQNGHEKVKDNTVFKKAAGVVTCSWSASTEFVKRHKLVDRGVNGIGKRVCWVAEKVAGGKDKDEAPKTEAQTTEPVAQK